ncbi:group II intron reverse transcriptase domain-containing protein [Candidatus Kaiserbacteria bacterium]|nr:group II intron reverse transcriptase domain-containing protein [Candidatus Kaiserbacteria bacterium]
MSGIRFIHTYEDIISVENLLAAWREFLRGKRKKDDVRKFQYHLSDNILALHRDLKDKTYRHGAYEAFKINDPKPRDIHKATVRDRLLHHAIYRHLYPFFDHTFIADSYSCRRGKGTHKAMDRFRSFAYQVSKNHTRTVWVLKCDIKKFFASIDQATLFAIVARYIPDKDISRLIGEIIGSFQTHTTMPIGRSVCMEKRKGLPLGNLTSQLLVNIYMNEFDQFVKHKLKARHYVRYADDFVVMSTDRVWLEGLIPLIARFLDERLALSLHPNKVSIATLASGVDFLGWVHFSDHRVLRTTTKRRMLRRTADLEKDDPTVRSYLGMLSHGNGEKLRDMVTKTVFALREPSKLK